MRKILYIASRAPTSYAGREYMINQNVNFFCDLGFKVDMFFFENKKIEKLKNVNKIYQFERPGILDILKSFFSGKKLSLQERLFYSNKAKKTIQSILKEDSYDVVIVDMVRMAYLVEDIDVKKILEYDDLLSMRYSRMLSDFDNSINLLGTYTEKFPPFIGELIKPFRKAVLRKESELIYRRELELSEKFDAITFTSPVEASKFSKMSNLPVVYYNPPSVAVEKNTRLNELNKASFFLVGNMKANHNLATLQMLVNIFKRKELQDKNISISIYGDYDTRAVEMCDGLDNIILHGVVNNISDIFNSNNCLVAPIPFGSGIKVKVIEAMGFGALVITNDIGAEGIGIKQNVNFLECSTQDEFAIKIIDVHNSFEIYKTIATNGTEYIQKNFAREVVLDNISNVFSNLGIKIR